MRRSLCNEFARSYNRRVNPSAPKAYDPRVDAHRVLQFLGLESDNTSNSTGRRQQKVRKQQDSLTRDDAKIVLSRKQNDVVRFCLLLRLPPLITHHLLAEFKPKSFPAYNLTFHDPPMKTSLQSESRAVQSTKSVFRLPLTTANTAAAQSDLHMIYGLSQLEIYLRRNSKLWMTDFEINELQMLQYPLFFNLSHVNATTAARVGRKLDLQRFHAMHQCAPHVVKWHTDQFPGLSWTVPLCASTNDPDTPPRNRNYSCVVTMFASGNVNILRLLSLEQVRYTQRIIDYIDECCGYDDDEEADEMVDSSSDASSAAMF
jgi:hypothetical protein